MTTTLTHPLQDARLAAGLTVVLAAGALALANFGGTGENGGPAAYAVSLAVVALLAAWLFGRVVPGTADPARTAWILAGVAVVANVAFWSGLPFVFGIAAVAAAARAGRAAPAALGALAVVAALVGCAIG